MAASVTTPWGRAMVVEEVVVRQEASGREFASVAQLLETSTGEPLVRFAYSTDGSVRRGPVTFRASDLEALRAGLGECRRLATALGLVPRPGAPPERAGQPSARAAGERGVSGDSPEADRGG